MRLLFAVQPGSGHLLPLLPLARALRAVGHDVVFASTGAFAPEVEDAGFACHVAGPPLLLATLPAAFPELAASTGVDRLRFVYDRVFLGDPAIEMARDLVALHSRSAFDVLVHDASSFAGGVAAEALGVPWAAVTVSSVTVDRRWLRDYTGHFERLRRAVGLGPDPDLAAPYRHLVISPIPRFLCADAELPPTFREARLETYDGQDGLPSWVAELPDRPTVYLTLGTVQNKRPEFFRTVAGGLAAEDLNLVITTGNDLDPSELDPLPPNARAVRFIPQAALLPHCSAVISHAGGGTLRGALWFGVPQVLIPYAADQFRNADIFTGLGLAVKLGHATLTGEEVRDAVRRVLDHSSFRERARWAAGQMLAMPGIEEAVRLVEGLVEA